MNHDELARDVVVAMIEHGLFDYVDAKATNAETIQAKTDAICKAFTQIAETAQTAHRLR